MTTVLLQTTMGDVKIELLDDTMPITTGNFRKLVEKGFYNGTIFHRVIAGFMIQGGDPEGTGFGGPGYTIKDELPANNRNARGTLSMAIAGPTGSIPSSGESYPVWKSSTPSPGRRPTAKTARGRRSRFRRRPLSREGSCLHLRGSRHQEVLADQVAVEVLTDELVVLMPELGQTRGVVLQGLHQADRGPARLLEEMAVVLGTQGRRDLHGTVERHIADGGPQTLHDDVRVSPLMGRCRFRIGRRHVGGREGEHPTDEQLRRPRVEGDAAPRFQDPQHFLDGDFRTRGEDVGELAQHDVELSIAEWKALHIALLPGDVVQFGDRRILFGHREELRGQVEAGHHGPRPTRGA